MVLMRYVLAALTAAPFSTAVVAQSLPRPQVLTQPAGNNSDFAASTAYVDRSAALLQIALSGKAPLVNPAFMGQATFSARPSFAGATPWDSGNLNPSTLAPIASPQFSGSVTAQSLAITGAGSTGDVSAMSVTPADGGVARSLTDLFSNQLHAINFGVIPGAADSGPALRSAFARAQQLGARLFLPAGSINVCTAAGDAEALLRIERYMDLVGQGRATKIIPCAAAGTRAVLLIKPLANAGGIREMLLSSFQVGDLNASTRAGGDGIKFDTTNLNGFIAKPVVDNVAVSDAGVGKYSIHHLNNPNPATGNLNGGLFGAIFQNSDFFGGVRFYKTGDSNNIVHNVIAGPNPGIDYEAIAGAATHIIDGNNITATGGSIILRNTMQAKVERNQTESFYPYSGTDGAQIVFDGVTDSTFRENNANAYDRVDVVLLKNGARGNTIENNSMAYSPASGKVAVRATGASLNTIGRQRSQLAVVRDASDNLSFTTITRAHVAVDAASNPTIGVFQKLTVGSGWADGGDTNFDTGLFAALMPDGTVRFRGTTGINSGTQSDTIAVLPPGLRPSKAVRIFPKGLGTGGNPWVLGAFNIDPAGNVSVLNVPAGARGVIQWDDASFSSL